MIDESAISDVEVSDDSAEPTGPPLFMMSGVAPGFEFSVLRRSYKGRVNRADEWVHMKLHPVSTQAPPVDAMSWQPNCRRHDLLLPVGVADTFSNPAVLLHTFEAEAGNFRKDLIIHIKITVLDDQPLHWWWERARAFSSMALAGPPSLPVVLALHDPSTTVMRRPPPAHIHLMAPARKLEGKGWGAATDLAVDGAHTEFARLWSEME